MKKLVLVFLFASMVLTKECPYESPTKQTVVCQCSSAHAKTLKNFPVNDCDYCGLKSPKKASKACKKACTPAKHRKDKKKRRKEILETRIYEDKPAGTLCR